MDNVFSLLPITQKEWEKTTRQYYINETIEEVIERWNFVQLEFLKDSDEEIIQCEYCGKYHQWGDCHCWSCEKCGKIYCDTCIPEFETDNGNILCKECR